MEIDRHESVRCWVRNLARVGYRIPRPPRGGSRWFYPDFIAWLHDGRVAVIEHKGGMEQANDVTDKKNAGRFWAERTGGVFVMTEDVQHGRPDFSELRRRLSK
jgi:type III restriction enzyme